MMSCHSTSASSYCLSSSEFVSRWACYMHLSVPFRLASSHCLCPSRGYYPHLCPFQPACATRSIIGSNPVQLLPSALVQISSGPCVPACELYICTLLSEVPAILCSASNVYSLTRNVDAAKICQGNQEKKFLDCWRKGSLTLHGFGKTTLQGLYTLYMYSVQCLN